MKEKILIVEDEFIQANGLRLILENAGFAVCELAESVAWAREVIRKEKPSLVILDIQLDGELTGIDLAKELRAAGIGFIYLSANSSQSVLEEAKLTEPFGFLVKPYREKDVLIAIEIAKYRQRQDEEARARQKQMLEKNLTYILQHPGNIHEKLPQLAMALQPEIPFDLWVLHAANKQNGHPSAIGLHRNGFGVYNLIELEQRATSVYPSKANEIAFSYINGSDQDLNSAADGFSKAIASRYGMQSLLHCVLPTEKGPVSLYFYSSFSNAYTPAHVAFLKMTSYLLTPVFEKLCSAENADTVFPAKGMLTGKQQGDAFKEIVGKNAALLKVFDYVSRIAPLDTAVLVLGESGTGKEQIARLVHELSARKNGPFVVVNCAALPANLMESELFGHEKGAFTGAMDKRIGKFESAKTGSIFLDEIGELSHDLQVKLLRTLQEKEVQRLGGNKTIRLDVRVIAATNRNLEKEVAEGRFRLDLYYRLCAFPIELPPLRDRKDDIPLLAAHFLKAFTNKTGREMKIAPNAMEQLLQYHWPGNIRELQHVVERSAVLSSFTSIEEFLFPVNISKKDNLSQNTAPQSMEEAERTHIINALKKCNNRIYGPGGAAELLKLPPTTLASKIKKLGIDKNSL